MYVHRSISPADRPDWSYALSIMGERDLFDEDDGVGPASCCPEFLPKKEVRGHVSNGSCHRGHPEIPDSLPQAWCTISPCQGFEKSDVGLDTRYDLSQCTPPTQIVNFVF